MLTDQIFDINLQKYFDNKKVKIYDCGYLKFKKVLDTY